MAQQVKGMPQQGMEKRRRGWAGAGLPWQKKH
jgi:hypothetical protein